MNKHHPTPEALVNAFFSRVWSPPHDISAIDELMTEDYEITTAGTLIQGRDNFKEWVRRFQEVLIDATNESLEIFTNQEDTRVVSRWVCSGINHGLLGLPADQQFISFTGIAIWAVRDGRLSACWVERSAWELYQSLRAQ